ncbi:MAG: lipopolysaccharide biosynthesis protein [Fastidiosipilaceae bacterium]
MNIRSQKSNKLFLYHRLFCLYRRAKYSSLYNNAFYLMLNTACTSVLGFVFWYVVARCFLSSDVGIGSALNSASSLVASFAGLGLGIGLVRFVPEIKEGAIRLINSAFTLAGVTAIAGSLLYLAGVKHWAPALIFLWKNHWLSGFFVLFTVSIALSNLIDHSFVAARTANYVFWKNLIANLIKLPLPVFVFASLKGFGIFAGIGVAFFITIALALFLFLPKVYKGYSPRPAWDSGMLKQVLPFSFTNYLSGLLNSVPTFIYPLMILNVIGPEQNAYYSMAWMIAMVLAIIPGSLSQSLFAEGSHNPERLGGGDGRRALVLAILLTIPAVGAVAFLGSWLLQFFGPAYAQNGTGVLRILVLSIIPLCVNRFFMTVNQVKKRVPLILGQAAYLAVISIGLGYLMLCKIGIKGIGVAYVIAQLSWAVIVVWPLWKDLNGNEKVNEKA